MFLAILQKEDLEHVIDIVKPDKLIIHHTSETGSEEEKLIISGFTELLQTQDGKGIEV
jgi:ribonuclease J